MNEWNKYFVVFDNNIPEAKKIVNKWEKIGNLLQDYQI